MITDSPLAAAPTTANPTPAARLTVEYWTVTMDEQASCGACDDTLAVLTRTLDTLRPLAEQLGLLIDLQPRTVTTWEDAVRHAIVASPTLRAAGIEVRPSHPDDSEARSWSWRGRATPALTEDAALDLLVRALAVRSQELDAYLTAGGPSPYVRQHLSDPEPARSPAPAPAPPPLTGGCGPTCS